MWERKIFVNWKYQVKSVLKKCIDYLDIQLDQLCGRSGNLKVKLDPAFISSGKIKESCNTELQLQWRDKIERGLNWVRVEWLLLCPPILFTCHVCYGWNWNLRILTTVYCIASLFWTFFCFWIHLWWFLLSAFAWTLKHVVCYSYL